MLKIKKLFLFYSFLLFSITFSLFLIQQATNHTIWRKKWTLRPKLPPGHLGWQLLKPLGSEAMVNQHIHLATIGYTTTITTLSFTCHCLHTPAQAQPNTACTAQHSLMHTASWLCIGSYFILPHILPFLCAYLSSQPHGCVEAVNHSLL